jgi:RND superfamily putative drug exporter
MTAETTGEETSQDPAVPRSFAVRHRYLILVVAAVLLPLTAALGANVASSLSVGGFVAGSSEFARGRQFLTEQLHGGTPNVVLVVTVKGVPVPEHGVALFGSIAVDEDGVRAAGIALTEELRHQPGVLDAGSYWTLGNVSLLRSTDGLHALVFGLVAGDEDEVRDRAERLSPLFTRDTDLIEVRVTGEAEVYRQVSDQAESDLRKAELLAAPFTLIGLVLVFRGLRAALLPLAVAVLAVTATFAWLRALSAVTDVSIFSLNLTTALGFGLAIDYSLFVVFRYREERALGHSLDLALRRTLQTAGRTVVFSAATVAVSLASLLVFPMAYLRSYAYAGISVVVLAALASVTVLPALIAVMGDRLGGNRSGRGTGEGFWGRQAHRVMRRPVLVTAAAVGVLVVLGLPFGHLHFGFIDDRVIPPSLSSRAANDTIRTQFTTREADAIGVVLPGVPGDDPASQPQIHALAVKLAALPNVSRIDAATGHYLGLQSFGADATTDRFLTPGSTWLSVVPYTEAISPMSEAIVRDIRDLDVDQPLLVTGPTARFVDSKDAVTDRLPWALLIIVVVTSVLLFAMLGSVVVPLKAVLVNVLSLTATFGAMVWIFQDGHLASLLDITATGSIDVFTPILMFCIAFGLSMDYEVFLLSRIKEDYDLTGDNTEAIAFGLDHTGRLVTAAALLLAIVFVSFMTSAVSIVKLVGLGLTMAVLVDAFLIRATLVPAVMKLAGRSNWWAPRPLRWLHLRFGIWEREPSDELDRLRDDAPSGRPR